LSYGLLCEIFFKEFLSTCLAASRLIQRSQASRGRVRAAGKALLNGNDKPVIGFAADVGASGRGAFHGCNQMRVARVAHKVTSRSRTRCGTYVGAMAEQQDKRTPAKRNMDENNETNRAAMVRTERRAIG
jgi:hypothetical protein